MMIDRFLMVRNSFLTGFFLSACFASFFSDIRFDSNGSGASTLQQSTSSPDTTPEEHPKPPDDFLFLETPYASNSNRLYRACKSGDLRTLMRYEAHIREFINVKDYAGKAMLHYACESGNVDIVLTLFKYGAEFHADESKMQPLHYACRKNADEVARILVIMGHPVSARDNAGYTPISYVLYHKNYNLANWIIRVGADRGLKYRGLNEKIIEASAINSLKLVKYLVEESPVRINLQSDSSLTAFDEACKNDNLEILEYLVQRFGTRVENYKRMIPIQFACQLGRTRLVNFLIRAGSPSIGRDHQGWTLIHHACLSNVEELILGLSRDHGVDHRVADVQGNTPVHLALMNKCFDAARVLIDTLGSPMSAENEERKSPLILAIENGSLEIVRILAEKGVDLTCKDGRSLSPLHHACRVGNSDIVEYLASSGRVNVNEPDGNGMYPLLLACESGTYNSVRALVKEGVDLNVSDRAGNNAVHHACVSFSIDILNFLHKQGIDFERPNRFGFTAYDLILKRKNSKRQLSHEINQKIIDLLLRWGINEKKF